MSIFTIRPPHTQQDDLTRKLAALEGVGRRDRHKSLPYQDCRFGSSQRRPKKVQNRVATAFRMAGTTLLNSKTYLGSRYRHLRKQLPSHATAIKAMARYLAVLVYRLLTHWEAWVDRGAAKYEQRRSEWELASLNSSQTYLKFSDQPHSAMRRIG